MTYNEFKMCCIIFCKTFEGRKYGEVVNGCHIIDSHSRVTKFPEFDCGYFVLNQKCVMWLAYNEELQMPLQFKSSLMFKSIQDFLNHFKIPINDIV